MGQRETRLRSEASRSQSWAADLGYKLVKEWAVSNVGNYQVQDVVTRRRSCAPLGDPYLPVSRSGAVVPVQRAMSMELIDGATNMSTKKKEVMSVNYQVQDVVTRRRSCAPLG